MTSAVLQAAIRYTARGWRVIPVPHRQKKPTLTKWTKLRLSQDQLSQHFGSGQSNIGVLLGEPSHGLVDVDLDCPEAILAADVLLPPTKVIFGRESAARSHRLYVIDEDRKRKSWKSPSGEMLIELRGTGAQTVFPPSVHPTGELIQWEAPTPEEPPRVNASELEKVVQRVAAASLLAKSWPSEGSRHDAALALAGVLILAGWSEDDATLFVRAVVEAAHDDELGDRLQAVQTTHARRARGEAVTARAKLAEMLGEEPTDLALRWLGTGRRGARAVPPITTDGSPYQVTDGGIVWFKQTRDGPQPTPLCNFRARIAEDVTLDDGVEELREFVIEACLRGRTTRFRLPAERFASMSWPADRLGAGAVLYPGYSIREHARVAIQTTSEEITERRIYAHMGWRQLEGGDWAFLHAGGAMGTSGPLNGIETDLPAELARFALPVPPEGEELVVVIEASLKTLDLTPDRIGIPLFAGIWRSVLDPTDFTQHITGPTGTFKSSVAAVHQAFFGTTSEARNLPANWSSTANALEGLAFTAKDTMLVIDEYSPMGLNTDRAALERKAERLIRGQGNRSGRQRLGADLRLRPTRPPRGSILSTGEETPGRQSLRGRMVIHEMEPGMIDVEVLTRCQRTADSGSCARCMAAFLKWLAPRIEQMRERLQRRKLELRAEFAQATSHRRTPEIMADLFAALEIFCEFALEMSQEKAITHAAAEELLASARHALEDAADAQDALQGEVEPVERFVQLLCSAVSSGDAHLAGPGGEAPGGGENPKAWGWRTDGKGTDSPWRSHGTRVGWVDGDDAYIDLQAAFRAAERMAVDGNGVGVADRTLLKRLDEAGVLRSKEPGKNTMRRTLEGRRRRVVHLSASLLEGEGQWGQRDQGSPGGTVEASTGPEPRPQANRTAKPTGPEDGASGAQDGPREGVVAPSAPLALASEGEGR